MGMHHPMTIVDAFTSEPFGGNPAAVCLLEERQSPEWMQSVAAEMNLAETAFLVPLVAGYELRWFTPTIEVALCGHAPLASAHVLWETGRLSSDTAAHFHTLHSGTLVCTKAGDQISMNFPAKACVEREAPAGLASALGAIPTWVGANGMDYLALFEDESIVRSMAPNHTKVAELGVRGIIVTAVSWGDQDFVSRFFAPGSGIPEDPVTGSAHCALGPFWAARLGKTKLVGYQASPRGGFVQVEVVGDRCILTGCAVTILEGTILC